MERDLWRAIDGRNLIGQAQGILMERYQLTAEQAFALLRRYSQAQNVKLAILALQLVESGMLADLALDAAPPPGATPDEPARLRRVREG
jgi:hypothetical protein